MNLIITCPRHFEEDAVCEIKVLFEKFGYDKPEITITEMPGILTVSMVENPIEMAEKARELIEDEPWAIRYCQRIIPIQKTSKSEIGQIVQNISKIYTIMKNNETYRITIEKRHSEISSKEMITEIAKIIPNKVSLENSDWIVLVEIIGSKAGVAVIRPNQIISIEKIKRHMSE